MIRAKLLTAPLSEVYSYLTGKQKGKQYGLEIAFLCSNHPDTVPSLFINDAKGVGYCFGCDWRFNRWQLLRDFGIKAHSHNNNGRKPFITNSFSKVGREVEALKALSKLDEAKEVETCATKFEARKCLNCGETFAVAYHCDHRLCQTCNQRHIAHFFDQHTQSLDFKLEIWGLTLAFPGRPLFNNGKSPTSNLKALLEEVRKTLAEIRRKYQPFGLFQHALVVRQVKVKHGIAWLKVHLLIDATRKEVEILRTYWANHYHWSPVRTVKEFWTVGGALEWLIPKAAAPLEEWETPEDLEIWLEATKHVPLIYGLGNFRKVKGGRGKSRTEKENREPILCPFCGSSETVFVGIVSKEEAWLWDKRLSPPQKVIVNAT